MQILVKCRCSHIENMKLNEEHDAVLAEVQFYKVSSVPHNVSSERQPHSLLHVASSEQQLDSLLPS